MTLKMTLSTGKEGKEKTLTMKRTGSDIVRYAKLRRGLYNLSGILLHFMADGARLRLFVSFIISWRSCRLSEMPDE